VSTVWTAETGAAGWLDLPDDPEAMLDEAGRCPASSSFESKSFALSCGRWRYGWPRVREVRGARRLMDDPRAVGAVVVVVMACFVFSAYLDAYAYVKVPSKVIPDAALDGQIGLTASWFVFTGFLFFLFGRGLSQGRPWNRALPDGYTGSLAAALVFGAALIADISDTEQIAVLIVAHDVNPVLPYVDRVLYLAGGRALVGAPEVVISGPTLSALYGTPIEVLRTSDGRLVVVGHPEAASYHPQLHPHEAPAG